MVGQHVPCPMSDLWLRLTTSECLGKVYLTVSWSCTVRICNRFTVTANSKVSVGRNKVTAFTLGWESSSLNLRHCSRLHNEHKHYCLNRETYGALYWPVIGRVRIVMTEMGFCSFLLHNRDTGIVWLWVAVPSFGARIDSLIDATTQYHQSVLCHVFLNWNYWFTWLFFVWQVWDTKTCT